MWSAAYNLGMFRGKLAVIFLAMIVVCTGTIMAQNAEPGSKPEAMNEAQPKADDISGMYTFLKDGEFVQINQEDDGTVTGFVSRYGDDETDKKLFLDQFFTKGSLKGNQITFATRAVHGTSFEFAGTVMKGTGKTRGDEGFRIIKGKLTRISTDEKGKQKAESRELEMKSFPADMDQD